MTADQRYFSPARKTRTRFKVQGSIFIATFAPAADEETAQGIITEVSAEFPDATHHAYAYRIGTGGSTIERSSDAREPAGTAGPPMLQILQGSNISDALVIGTRYFGGTRLGIGGLTRAYRDCARLALEDAALITKEPLCNYQLVTAYEDLGALTRLIETLEGVILDIEYSDKVTISLQLPARQSDGIEKGFESVTRGRGQITIV